MTVSKDHGQHVVAMEVAESPSSAGPWSAVVVMSDGARLPSSVGDAADLHAYLAYAQLTRADLVLRGAAATQMGFPA